MIKLLITGENTCVLGLKCPTLHFGLISLSVSLSPSLGSALTVQSLVGIFSLPLSLPLPHLHTHALARSLSQKKNKKQKNKCVFNFIKDQEQTSY